MRVIAACVMSIGLVACSAEGATPPRVTSPSPATASPTATTSASAVAGGCGFTAVVQGSIPQWLDDAGGHNNPTGVPYAIAHPPLAAGFLFGNPLRAGHPNNPANKVLWVVRTARNGPLTIDGHPLSAATPAIHETLSDSSSPGEIYPSFVDVPTAGCWQLDLRWANGHTQVELMYA